VFIPLTFLTQLGGAIAILDVDDASIARCEFAGNAAIQFFNGNTAIQFANNIYYSSSPQTLTKCSGNKVCNIDGLAFQFQDSKGVEICNAAKFSKGFKIKTKC
jgi:hypothetical protein